MRIPESVEVNHSEGWPKRFDPEGAREFASAVMAAWAEGVHRPLGRLPTRDGRPPSGGEPEFCVPSRRALVLLPRPYVASIGGLRGLSVIDLLRAAEWSARQFEIDRITEKVGDALWPKTEELYLDFVETFTGNRGPRWPGPGPEPERRGRSLGVSLELLCDSHLVGIVESLETLAWCHATPPRFGDDRSRRTDAAKNARNLAFQVLRLGGMQEDLAAVAIVGLDLAGGTSARSEQAAYDTYENLRDTMRKSRSKEGDENFIRHRLVAPPRPEGTAPLWWTSGGDPLSRRGELVAHVVYAACWPRAGDHDSAWSELIRHLVSLHAGPAGALTEAVPLDLGFRDDFGAVPLQEVARLVSMGLATAGGDPFTIEWMAAEPGIRARAAVARYEGEVELGWRESVQGAGFVVAFADSAGEQLCLRMVLGVLTRRPEYRGPVLPDLPRAIEYPHAPPCEPRADDPGPRR